MRGPTQPVCQITEPCEEPARGVKLVFSRAGKVVARATTDKKGWYRVTLTPGRYAVTTLNPRVGRNLTPKSATVAQGPRQARRLRHRHRDSLTDDEVHELPGTTISLRISLPSRNS